MRRVCYVSGTRADFGLMRSTLASIACQPELSLSVCVTGMHLEATYGHTVDEIEAAGYDIAGRIPVSLADTSGAAMARGLAEALRGMVDLFLAQRPDLVLLLGDRGEMMAGALAALHLNIPIVHIHGGERSGTIDEPVRHAISKLAHYHFTATEAAAERLRRMGEAAERVFVTGAPGLDDLLKLNLPGRAQLCRDEGIPLDANIALLLFHPVVQEHDKAGEQMRAVLEAVNDLGVHAVCLQPNADAGGGAVREALEAYAEHPRLHLHTHLPRDRFIAWMAVADLMLGNSSSGIIEAASFGLPVVNIGSRQNCRERGPNVLDADPDRGAVIAAAKQALGHGRFPCANPYGDGQAGERIARLLSELPLDEPLLSKLNAY